MSSLVSFFGAIYGVKMMNNFEAVINCTTSALNPPVKINRNREYSLTENNSSSFDI